MNLKGQRVVVLGGTSGIGLATAEAAAAQGAEVAVVSSRRASVDRALAALPAGTLGRAADLGDPAQVRAVLQEIGEFDHLVFTAGEALDLMPVATLDPGAARDFFTVRYFGALAAVQAAAPLIRPGGSITLTTGIAKDRPGPGWAVAASICGAIESLTRALAVELAPVRVNAVSPGVVRSPLWASMGEADRQALFEGVGAAVPAGRVGEVGDVAPAYLYCMTQPWVTGTVLTVDGGAILV
ncbi:SDR family oxidoreductase [Microbispora sp. ATCC PTA-5024]|uniref:SDR family oxidoreductase n=1 Tax=Microbispora sp. ATCC PTA-5024 TaxID=316330 RepID=UPI0003DB821E|nr:SDR family oxidoreductase [Microbispora sp. ATCC PTA-5024]ETK31627.1 short-chain dehydrogenase [Microbispora sp. ATCC PTA-5024]